ncbi:MAG: hypothetical protein KDI15_13690 [Thiothrix sp.]|nr:hypothetical protein [Thiothrix sp.]HPE62423.1 hypothetical protein [Thiolinea sp.]
MTVINAQTSSAPLPFEQRLALVRAEIASRVADVPEADRNPARARLWVRWINRALLAGESQASGSVPFLSAFQRDVWEVQP